MTVGNRIRYAREIRGISQEELAKKLGLKDKSSVCKIEKAGDNISTRSVRKYADALGTTPAFLMGWTDEEEETQDEELLQMENDYMRNIELYEDTQGTAGVALFKAHFILSKPELQKLYEMATIMFPELIGGDKR